MGLHVFDEMVSVCFCPESQVTHGELPMVRAIFSSLIVPDLILEVTSDKHDQMYIRRAHMYTQTG